MPQTSFKLENYIDEVYKTMRAMGVFLTSGTNPPNPMAVSWGLLGNLWNRPVFAAAVKPIRHTYELIKRTGVFTVSVPRKQLLNELVRCATLSGANCDKFSELHLHPVKAKSVNTYIVGDCGLHLECKVIYTSAIAERSLDDEIDMELYPDGVRHTMFYGEILEIYEN